ncbi:MAG: hypothetical protein RLZZ93_1396, partial [Actinomycetota bacterium]
MTDTRITSTTPITSPNNVAAVDNVTFTAGQTGSDAQQRAIGALIGAVVGDALGAPFEFGPRGAFTGRFPSAVLAGSTEMVGGGAFDWAPGEFTDDSQ